MWLNDDSVMMAQNGLNFLCGCERDIRDLLVLQSDVISKREWRLDNEVGIISILCVTHNTELGI